MDRDDQEQEKPLHLLTPDELRKRYPPQGPPRRLTGEELEELRRKLNADPEAALGEAELSGYYELGIVRYPDDIDDLAHRVRTKALDTPPAASARVYAEGILDAIAWARGERREAPVTGRIPKARLPRTAEMNREAADAAEALAGRGTSGRSQSYTVGVEATLLWLTCSSPADPWD